MNKTKAIIPKTKNLNENVEYKQVILMFFLATKLTFHSLSRAMCN